MDLQGDPPGLVRPEQLDDGGLDERVELEVEACDSEGREDVSDTGERRSSDPAGATAPFGPVPSCGPLCATVPVAVVVVVAILIRSSSSKGGLEVDERKGRGREEEEEGRKAGEGMTLLYPGQVALREGPKSSGSSIDLRQPSNRRRIRKRIQIDLGHAATPVSGRKSFARLFGTLAFRVGSGVIHPTTILLGVHTLLHTPPRRCWTHPPRPHVFGSDRSASEPTQPTWGVSASLVNDVPTKSSEEVVRLSFWQRSGISVPFKHNVQSITKCRGQVTGDAMLKHAGTPSDLDVVGATRSGL